MSKNRTVIKPYWFGIKTKENSFRFGK